MDLDTFLTLLYVLVDELYLFQSFIRSSRWRSSNFAMLNTGQAFLAYGGNCKTCLTIRVGGEPHGEGAAFSERAFDINPSTMRVHDFADNR